MPTDWKDTSHDLGEIAYVIGKDTSYYSILVIDWLRKMLRDEPVQILIDAPRLPDSID